MLDIEIWGASTINMKQLNYCPVLTLVICLLKVVGIIKLSQLKGQLLFLAHGDSILQFLKLLVLYYRPIIHYVQESALELNLTAFHLLALRLWEMYSGEMYSSGDSIIIFKVL